MKIERLKVILHGAVQGVGFRPFVFRLANELGLAGSVLNSSQGVFIEAEGARDGLDQFLIRLEEEKPPRAIIQGLESAYLESVGHHEFVILESEETGPKTTLILPDIAPCPDCLREIFDPHDRRHLYPFTNCTNCGPRFSIIESLPYDRAHTVMKKFRMCADCEREYHDPRNRRFHAQPNACPNCGPQLELWQNGAPEFPAPDALEPSAPIRPGVLARGGPALLLAARAIRSGEIVALKGVGGFQLIADARNQNAVLHLRKRKHRDEKPFALMFPSLEVVRGHCQVGEAEARLLRSPEAPIVLLERRPAARSGVAPSVAPRNPYLGVMLPSSPLHHVLMRELGFPVVATSGNLGGEPICIDEYDATRRLNGVADLFLVHDRPIVRQLDDSIARVVLGGSQILRRARGFAPLPIQVAASRGIDAARPEFETAPAWEPPASTVLGVGAHLKNTVALAIGGQVFLSQHIGDLETEPAAAAFRKAVTDLQELYETTPGQIACDLHPEYLSTRFAEAHDEAAGQSHGTFPAPALIRVQHHYAHVLACAAENEVEPPLLGIAWDGTGLGTDETIWGGEFLLVNETGFERMAHLREFPLPGGDAAIRQPCRIAFGLLWEMFGDELFRHHRLGALRHFNHSERSLIQKMLAQKINCPMTSSAGRLFDAVASIAGLCQQMSFEGQAAMELEFAAHGFPTDAAYEIRLSSDLREHAFVPAGKTPLILGWELMILELLDDLRRGVPVGIISTKFHNALAEAMVAVARHANLPRVVLGGGCFQNKLLLERSVTLLQAAGFRVCWPQRVPPNDGGIALGQAVAALRPAVVNSANELCV